MLPLGSVPAVVDPVVVPLSKAAHCVPVHLATLISPGLVTPQLRGVSQLKVTASLEAPALRVMVQYSHWLT